jgi:hypothetical protein
MVPGTYCNEVEVVPGGTKTRSGKTAVVQIGVIPGLCPGEAVLVTKTVDSVALVSTDTSSAYYTYSLDVDFTIKIDNIGAGDLMIKEFIDLLSVGFSYLSTSPSGDITEIPAQQNQVTPVDRQRLTWRFNQGITVASRTSETLKFSTTGALTRGDYWSDLLVDFDGGSFPEDRYTWPTALISVKDIYDVTAIAGDGSEQVIALQVWIGGENGTVESWNIR